MKRLKKPRAVWLGRRADWDGDYEIGSKASVWEKHAGFVRGKFLADFCPKDFERITGIRLEPGESVKVRIVVEEV